MLLPPAVDDALQSCRWKLRCAEPFGDTTLFAVTSPYGKITMKLCDCVNGNERRRGNDTNKHTLVGALPAFLPN